MIVVEGPDGAGKTTLVKHLQAELGLEQGERGVTNRDELWKSTRADTYTALAQAVGGHHPVMVWDRLFFSEFAYHEVVGRSCEFSPQDKRFITRILSVLECPIIFCLPPLEAVKENVGKDKQMAGVVDNIGAIYSSYEDMIDSIVGPEQPYCFEYDYTGNSGMSVDLDVLTENCRSYMKTRSMRSW